MDNNYFFQLQSILKINKSPQHDVPVWYVFYYNGQMNHTCNNRNTTSQHVLPQFEL